MLKIKPKTKISWEDERAGTVTVWIDGATREQIRQDGKPNPGYSLEWQDELRRMGVSYEYIDLADEKYEQFPPKDRALVARAYTMIKNGEQVQSVANKLEKSRTTIYRWMKKLGMVNKRGGGTN